MQAVRKVLFVDVIVLACGQQPRATRSLYHPSPHWDGEENGKKGKKLEVGIRAVLTEQQRKQTVTTIILVRRIYKTNSEMHRATLTARCPARSRAATAFPLASSPNPKIEHDSTWY